LFSLSEYSDENMMDASNLSICFGPTLLPVPNGKDPVQYQTYVNELIKNIIVHFEAVFPFEGEVLYEKCIVEDDRLVS
jgi:SLIT-ROBO Rho GTPase activating protein